MERLTNADINELTYFFTTPAPAHLGGSVAAQQYDAGGGGTYDQTTDFRLENLVTAALSRAKDEWSRVKTVIDVVADGMDGRRHVEILHRAFAEVPPGAVSRDEFFYPEVAIVAPTAIRRGRELAVEEERWRLVETSWTSSMRNADSPMTVAMRVLETDALLDLHGFIVTDDVVRWTVRTALERATKGKAKQLPANVAFSAQVRAEMHELVAAAGDAYRRARKALGATRRATRVEARKKSEALLDEMLGKKRAKESARFAAKLKRSA